MYHCTTPAPPTPTEITTQIVDTSSVRVTWQWTSSGPAPNCFNTTTMIYRPEEGDECSKKLSDPAATEATLTNLKNNTCYTITVVATAGGHRRESVARRVLFPLQGMPRHVYLCIPVCNLELFIMPLCQIYLPQW